MSDTMSLSNYEWKEFSIVDFAEILNQKRIPLSSMERETRKGKYPYYGASGVIDYIDDFIFEGEHVLISEDGENLKSRNTPIAFKASGQFWVNNHAHILKGKKDFHNLLIVYYLQNLDLNPFLTGAVQPKLNKAALTSIPFFLPSDEKEQRAIASVLSILDDKIDLLHRQNATIEKMAETIFRQMMSEHDLNGLQDGQDDEKEKSWQSKNPENHVQDNMEKAKEDWEEGKLSDLIIVKYGKDHKNLLNGKIPVYGSGGIMRYADRALYDKESVLIPRKGSLNNVMYINEPFWTVDTMFYTEMRKANLAKFIFYFVKGLDLASMNVGSAVPSMTTEVLNNLPIDIPPENVLNHFEQTLAPLYKKMKSNYTQISTLTALRDTLLPKLMSGEVRVSLEHD